LLVRVEISLRKAVSMNENSHSGIPLSAPLMIHVYFTINDYKSQYSVLQLV